jgi:hypothetical protein
VAMIKSAIALLCLTYVGSPKQTSVVRSASGAMDAAMSARETLHAQCNGPEGGSTACLMWQWKLIVVLLFTSAGVSAGQ